MRVAFHPSLLVLLLWLSLAAAQALHPTPVFAQRPPRYSALLQSGQRIEGEALTNWHATAAHPLPDAQPMLDAHPLLAEDRFRWLRDRRLTPLPDAAAVRVELFGGDCLPGTVVAFFAGNEAAFRPQPAHFLVEPAVGLRPPQPPAEISVRVRSSCVQRIVWEPGQRHYQPSTAFYRDGRRLEFRAIRFGAGHADVLSADGRQRIGFGELAELHLPLRDFWQVHLEELATLSPDCQADLLRVETTDGLRATSTLARLRVHTSGNQQDPTRWSHGLQPAWSLDMLWVPHAQIWLRCLLPATEIPLSRFTAAVQPLDHPANSVSGPGRTDRNIRGGPLACGGQEFGWGIGVQAESRLAFDLPAAAESFQTSVGLDRIAGLGGCVRARITLGAPSGTELFTSPLLVGSREVIPTGSLPLAGPDPKRLVLRVEMAHHDRPAGADPLNIRDLTDWLDPVVHVNPDALRAEVRQGLVGRFAAWQGWSLELPAGTLTGSETWDELAPSPGQFVVSLGASAGPLILRRRIELGEDDRWLVVAASRPTAGPDVSVQVLINGQAVAESKVPLHDRRNPDFAPLVVPLAEYQSRGPVDIEVRQTGVSPDMAADDSSAADTSAADRQVAWRALVVTRQLPMRYAIFEDDALLTVLAADQDAPDAPEALDAPAGGGPLPQPQPKIVAAEHANSGQAILVVPKGITARLQLPDPVAIRERPQWGEYRFLRIAIRKVGSGRADIRLQSVDAASPRRYDAGLGDLVHPDARRIWGGQFGEQWVVVTRDLFGDFGPLDLTALDLATPDGQQVEFDQIYLARSPNDLNGLPLPRQAQ